MATVSLTLKVWRQKNSQEKGRIVDYRITNISNHMSPSKVLDVLNEQLVEQGEESMAFGHDCREGICGMCSLFIDGETHGPDRGVTTCQLRICMLRDGDTITIEPWRATAFPVVKDLMVNRTALERIQQAEEYVSVNTSGNTQNADAVPIPKRDANRFMDATACIDYGACVATCKNSSAMLFMVAKVSQSALFPQGRVETTERVLNTVNQMEHEDFGNYTNTSTCEVEYPKDTSLENIARLSREYLKASIR